MKKLQFKFSYVRGSELPPNDNMCQSWVLFHSDETQMTELLRTILKNIASTKEIQQTLDSNEREKVCEYLKSHSLMTTDLLNSTTHYNSKEETKIEIATINDIIGKPQKSLLFSSKGRPSQTDWKVYTELVKTNKNSEILVFHIGFLDFISFKFYTLSGITILKNNDGKIEQFFYQFNSDVDLENEHPTSYEKEYSQSLPEYEQILYIDDMSKFMTHESQKESIIRDIKEIEQNPLFESMWGTSISEIKNELNEKIEYVERYKSRMETRVLNKLSCTEEVTEICK